MAMKRALRRISRKLLQKEGFVAKPEWGTKRQCPACGGRFYDLGRADPVVCIKCEHAFEPEVLLKPRRGRPEDKPVESDEPALADDVEEDQDDDTISLEDIDEADVDDDEDAAVVADIPDIELDDDIDVDEEADDKTLLETDDEDDELDIIPKQKNID